MSICYCSVLLSIYLPLSPCHHIKWGTERVGKRKEVETEFNVLTHEDPFSEDSLGSPSTRVDLPVKTYQRRSSLTPGSKTKKDDTRGSQRTLHLSLSRRRVGASVLGWSGGSRTLQDHLSVSGSSRGLRCETGGPRERLVLTKRRGPGMVRIITLCGPEKNPNQNVTLKGHLVSTPTSEIQSLRKPIKTVIPR